MALSNELISQFVKATQDTTKTNTETTAYGKIVVSNGVEYVQLDGSDLLTPISSTTVVNDGDRVIVTVKNHTATVTGDLTNPSASNKEVQEIGNKISEFEIVIADKVTTEQLEAEIARIETLRTEELEATNAKIETLNGKVAEIDTIKADVVEVEGKITANEADITTLRADIADFKDVTAEEIDAVKGNFNTLDSDYADFKVATTNKLTANEASIADLETNKLDTVTANAKYATIDFSNIGEAAIEKLFSDSGIIKDLIMSDGKVTGELVGVTIKGDLIEGNTVKADKLVIQGEDGLYYKLNVNALGEATASSDEKYQNGLDGSNIIAESITAEKIAVDDLVAFGATIGGFNITNNSIYSGVKESVSNTTRGIYLDNEGQVNIGDSNNYLKFYVDEDGTYKLELQANSIKFGASNTSIEEYINNTNHDMIKEVEESKIAISDGIKIIDINIYGKTNKDSGKNIFNKSITPAYKNYATTTELDNGVRIAYSGTGSFSSTVRVIYRILDLTDYDGCTIRMKCNFKINGTSDSIRPNYCIGYIPKSASNILVMDSSESESEIISFISDATSKGSRNHLCLVLDANNGGIINEGDYVDFTDIIITIDNEDMSYEEFYETKPSIESPGKITNVGTYNSETDKYDINIVRQIQEDSTVENITTISLTDPLRSVPNKNRDVLFLSDDILTIERNIGVVILDGTEDWYDFGEGYYATPYFSSIYNHDIDDDTVPDNILCDRFNIISVSDLITEGISGLSLIWDSGDESYFCIRYENNNITSVEEFETWLTENNVTIYYEMVTSTTESLIPIDLPVMDKEYTNIYYGNCLLAPTMKIKYYTKSADVIYNIETTLTETTNDLYKIIVDQKTEILATTESLILQAAADYVITGDFEAYKETVESQLQVMADNITLSFTTTSDAINDLETSTSDFETTVKKYFQFSEDGLIIGGDTSAIKLTIDNDEGIIFSKNGEQFGYWDGDYFYTGNIKIRVNERAQLGNYAYIPRSDDSLMFLKVE